MAVSLDPGYVLCPPCGGLGVWPTGVSEYLQPCRLCNREGQVPEDVAEAFWDCVRERWEVGIGTRSNCTTKVVGSW